MMADCPHDLNHAPSWGAAWGEVTWTCGLCGAEATAMIDESTVRWTAAPDDLTAPDRETLDSIVAVVSHARPEEDFGD